MKKKQAEKKQPIIKQWRIFLGLVGVLLVVGIFFVVVINPRNRADADYIDTLLPRNLFSSDVWSRKEADADNFSRRTVELNRADPVSLVYLDFLRFDASSPQPQTALEASQKVDETWIAGALSSYSTARRVKSCEFGEIRLYEYDVIFNRIAYNLRYWVIPLTSLRTATLIVAVTVDNRPYFDELSRTLRPNETACA